jgi:hypothetical protein
MLVKDLRKNGTLSSMYCAALGPVIRQARKEKSLQWLGYLTPKLNAVAEEKTGEYVEQAGSSSCTSRRVSSTSSSAPR